MMILLFLLSVLYIILIALATTFSPIIISSDLMLDKRNTFAILLLSFSGLGILLFYVLAQLGFNPFGDLYSPIFHSLIDIILMSLPILSIVSYIIILVNMVKLGYFKTKTNRKNHFVNIIFFGVELISGMLPIIYVENNGQTLMFNWFTIGIPGTSFLILATPIIGIIINIIFRDTRKTFAIDSWLHLICLTISIGLMSETIQSPVSCGVGLILMLAASFAGSFTSVIINSWYGMITTVSEGMAEVKTSIRSTIKSI